MAESKQVKVKAVRDFQNAHVGSREKGERFDYDADKDPARLIADGYVEAVESAAPAEPKGK